MYRVNDSAEFSFFTWDGGHMCLVLLCVCACFTLALFVGVVQVLSSDADD